MFSVWIDDYTERQIAAHASPEKSSLTQNYFIEDSQSATQYNYIEELFSENVTFSKSDWNRKHLYNNILCQAIQK